MLSQPELINMDLGAILYERSAQLRFNLLFPPRMILETSVKAKIDEGTCNNCGIIAQQEIAPRRPMRPQTRRRFLLHSCFFHMGMGEMGPKR